MSLAPLRQSIINTLAYFDMVDYPLTKEELFAYLWQPPALGYKDFVDGLDETAVVNPPSQGGRGVLASSQGFYFLPGREQTVDSRGRRLLISDEKMKIALKAAKKLRSVPFLCAIFVCNSVGAEIAMDDSDIDFFIVTASKRIWIARFFANFILRVWRLRTYKNRIKNRVCLSFFADINHLDLSNLRIAKDDIHFAYWIQQMISVYDPQNYYSQMLKANTWIDTFMPYRNKEFSIADHFKVKDSRVGKIWKKVWQAMWAGAYGDLIEAQAKAWQWGKMKLSVKNKAEAGEKGVVIGDGTIKLHENDSRVRIRDKWEQKIKI